MKVSDWKVLYKGGAGCFWACWVFLAEFTWPWNPPGSDILRPRECRWFGWNGSQGLGFVVPQRPHWDWIDPLPHMCPSSHRPPGPLQSKIQNLDFWLLQDRLKTSATVFVHLVLPNLVIWVHVLAAETYLHWKEEQSTIHCKHSHIDLKHIWFLHQC